mmetsp:Transcript_36421/g.85451  ORF Transcript_36421/g.85451 Transcript_36421/m.85451 type:complete len:409 (+) Transcript_36421:407-1633(+)
MTELFTNLICRPPRKRYDIEDLGPHSFHLHEGGGKGKACIRHDLVLTNRQGHRLECSHYVPAWIGMEDAAEAKQQPRSWQWQSQDLDSPKHINSNSDPGNSCESEHCNLPLPTTPCVVYLHGNSGCRLDADDLVDEYLARGLSLFSFDFQGCGVSGGDWVTLGGLERTDLECVLDYLSGLECVSGIALHGRSMGAATALMVASCDRYYHLIAGMVLDSCYTSVRSVLRDCAQGYVGRVPLLPDMPLLPVGDMVESTIDALRAAVLTRAGFDLDKIDVVSSAKHCQAPVLIAHAEDDTLVPAHHCERLVEEYGGPKTVCIFPEGGHNSPRPDGFNARAAEFLVACFQREKRMMRLMISSRHRAAKYCRYGAGLVLLLAVVWVVAALLEGLLGFFLARWKCLSLLPRQKE